MPGSVDHISSALAANNPNIVQRSDSNRSDRSDASAYSSEGGSSKKVSFNKAVRVKKYTTPPINPTDIDENKFWFKVYKSHQYKPESSDSRVKQTDDTQPDFDNTATVRPLSTIVESGDSISLTSTPEMSRKSVPSNYESSTANSRQRMVNKNNNNIDKIVPKSSTKPNRVYERDISPSYSSRSAKLQSSIPKEPEIDYLKGNSGSNANSPLRSNKVTPESTKTPQSKRNPIVNGVKVMFGMSPSLPKKGKTSAKIEQSPHDSTIAPQKQQSVIVHSSPHSKESQNINDGNQKNLRNESPNRSKINKLDLYRAPSRNANVTNRKLLQDCDNSNQLAVQTKNTDNAKYDDKSLKTNKKEKWSDIGNETKPLDEVINNAKLDLVSRTDSDEEHHFIDSSHMIPTEVWKSGPQLLSENTDFEKSVSEMPGEGKIYSTKEEGSKVWQNKTRRRYYEMVPKQHDKQLKAIENTDKKQSTHHNVVKATTDDEKIVTAKDLDDIFINKSKHVKDIETVEDDVSTSTYIYSYIPTVRDVGIQCNRKRTNRHLTKQSSTESSFRVIKSKNDGLVTAYSDVPLLQHQSVCMQTPVSKHEIWDENAVQPHHEAIYSQIDKTKKKSVKVDDANVGIDPNYPIREYRTSSPISERRSRISSRPQSGLRYQGSDVTDHTNKSVVKNTTKGYGFKFGTGVGPEINLPKSPQLKTKTRSAVTSYTEPEVWRDSQPRDRRRKEVTEEILEETISISNASSDDMMQHNQNTDTEEFLTPRAVIKEIDHKRKEISYENVSPNQRQLLSGDAFEGATTNGGGLWYRDIDEDYRRGMAQSEVSYPAGNEPTFYTLSRVEKDSHRRDYSPPPRHAYTLDRKHLKERKKRLEEISNNRHEQDLNMRLREKSKNGIHNERQYRSNADLPSEHMNKDQRGGLAAAYKSRQEKRASSLNRMTSINEGRVSPTYSNPRSYLSHSHLNSAGNSAHSSSDSDTVKRHKQKYVHDRQPIVMYIPAVSHHNKKAEEPDRLSGILRRHSISSKRSNKSKQGKTSASSDIIPTKPADYPKSYSKFENNRPNQDEELDEIVELKDTKDFGKNKKSKKTGLSRRHSIPKDTKFPWLQKLKFKVRSKEP